jgi:lysyl-tRNA synthetase class II
MKNQNLKSLITCLLASALIGGISVTFANPNTIPAKTLEAARQASNAGTIQKPVQGAITPQNQPAMVNPLAVVAYPQRFLNQQVRIKGKFDKFSTLGLDYAPAMRSSEQYISFLIQRPDVYDHNVPLSEMKIFMTREVAEKNIDLNSGDIVEFTGKVFSNALGDVWVDAQDFKVVSKIEKKQN